MLGLVWYGAGKYTNYERDSNKHIRYKEAKNLNEIPRDFQNLNRDFKNIMDTDLSNLKEDLSKNKQNTTIIADQKNKGSLFAKTGKAIKDFADKIF